MKRSLVAVFALVASVCLAGKISIPGGNKVTKQGVVSMSADWVKDKGDKFDIALNLTNESDKPILIMLDDMHCKRGNQDGTMVHTFFNTGERAINFAPGQLKHFNLVCDVREATKGHYRVWIGRVFANPNDDGKTKGKVLATNVEWMLSQWDAR